MATKLERGGGIKALVIGPLVEELFLRLIISAFESARIKIWGNKWIRIRRHQQEANTACISCSKHFFRN